MKKILIAVSALFILSVAVWAQQTDYIEPSSAPGSELYIRFKNTDTNAYQNVMRLVTGPDASSNIYPDVKLDGVRIMDRFDGKQNYNTNLQVLSDLGLGPSQMVRTNASGIMVAEDKTAFKSFLTIQAADITDSTSVGRAVLTAANAAAARSAIGAGSSSFSGDYPDLTNKPTIPAAQIQSDWTQASTGALDYIKNKPTRSFTNNASRSFVVTAAAANGFQLSSTKDTQVSYSVTVSSAVQIGVATNVSGYVILEIAATNSSTAGDWQEISRVGTGQNIGLAIALSSTQTVSGSLNGIVPAGYYTRLRTVNASGTPTYTYLSGQETLLK